MPGTSKNSSRKGPAITGRTRRVLAGLLLAALAGLVLVACGGSVETDGETIRLVIPAGTSEKVNAGLKVEGIPDRISAKVGDTLVVENRDTSTQFISGFAISPGQTMKIPLLREGTYMTNCSAHRNRSIEMVVKA